MRSKVNGHEFGMLKEEESDREKRILPHSFEDGVTILFLSGLNCLTLHVSFICSAIMEKRTRMKEVTGEHNLIVFASICNLNGLATSHFAE